MDYRQRITIEPGKRGGKPCIRGLRITVYEVLEYLASGMSEAEILNDFPDLTREDIRACLAFAARPEPRPPLASTAPDRERKLVTIPRVCGCCSTRISRPGRCIPCPRLRRVFPGAQFAANEGDS
jgi:uncharacterized protein (DUF433 family)